MSRKATSYVPGATSACHAPFASLMATLFPTSTVTPGSGAPAWSRTWPEIVRRAASHRCSIESNYGPALRSDSRRELHGVIGDDQVRAGALDRGQDLVQDAAAV